MRNEVLKKGFLFYALSTIAMALLMMNFIKSSSVLELMDFEGWIFLIVSCISHASQLALVPFLVFAILVGIRLPRVATVVQAIVTALLIILLYLDSQVYALYHFHINGFVLNMVFGGGMTSKLFMNVREKRSLCYDIGSSYQGGKGILTVGAGMDCDQIQTVEDEVLCQLEQCRRGIITPQ